MTCPHFMSSSRGGTGLSTAFVDVETPFLPSLSRCPVLAGILGVRCDHGAVLDSLLQMDVIDIKNNHSLGSVSREGSKVELLSLEALTEKPGTPASGDTSSWQWPPCRLLGGGPLGPPHTLGGRQAVRICLLQKPNSHLTQQLSC